MICFLATANQRFTIGGFLESEWGKPLGGRIRVVGYEDIFLRSELPRATWVFTDLDRLTPGGRDLAAHLFDALTAAGLRALNHPHRVWLRYELLARLHEAGINRFRAVRAHEYRGGLRFPVFIREENEHGGSIGGLLHSDEEVRDALAGLVLRRLRPKDLLVVEFVDTRSNGLFRKYSAYWLDGEVLPRNHQASGQWEVKSAVNKKSEERAAEEFRYVQQNPHEPFLRRVFEMARIDYGRIDYSLLGDQPQVWEINTAPTLGAGPRLSPRTPEEERYRDLLRPARALFQEAFRRRLEAIDHPEETGSVAVSLPASLLDRWKSEECERERLARRRSLALRVAANPIARGIRSLLEPSLRRVLMRFSR